MSYSLPDYISSAIAQHEPPEILQQIFNNIGANLQDEPVAEAVARQAASSTHFQLLSWLLDNNVFPEPELLHIAARQGDGVVKWLVKERGLSVNANWSILHGDTLLLNSVRNGHLETVKWLVQEGASVSDTTSGPDGYTALLLAAAQGDLAAVQWLLKEGGSSMQEKDRSGRSVLMLACKNRHFEIIRWLINERGASANEVDPEGNSVLFWAASGGGSLEHVQWLIEEVGVSTGHRGKFGETVLLVATVSGCEEVVTWLLEEGWSSMDEKDLWGIDLPASLGEEWISDRCRTFSSGWSIRSHHKFPRRYRMFCGVALWCLSGTAAGQYQPRGCKKEEEGDCLQQSSRHCGVCVVLPPELIGLMFCFWHGEVFAFLT
eukprot:TRINITY_DN66838_c6_g13_i1.p1 TRINITY_DN66838_c6_g13~~TRINITY_DN66838_c6_g13_i1.p1  ORF type:complete len:376 (+),score=32.62 TRINITY_DN66838_c6_g13_i1:67-1194(+)